MTEEELEREVARTIEDESWHNQGYRNFVRADVMARAVLSRLKELGKLKD
jgi:hypothetical protein